MSIAAMPLLPYKRLYYSLVLLLLAAAVSLTFISWLRLCSEECKEGHSYEILGLPFETWGFAMLVTAFGLHALSISRPVCQWLLLLLLYSSLGAELWFIYLQKYVIGHWCPVCLSIAASLTLAALCQTIALRIDFKYFKMNNLGDLAMQYKLWSLLTPLALATGFFFSLFGVAKFDPLMAAENTLKDKIAFGDTKSNIEIYLFTDWQCPSCRKIEPQLEKLINAARKQGKFIFVDLPVHSDTNNFTPYNLAFLVNNKRDYLKLRDKLDELAQSTGTPTEKQVEQLAKNIGADYRPLNYAEVATGMRYYKELANQFDVNATPTLVIVNTANKKGKKLKGAFEITETNLVNSINAVR